MTNSPATIIFDFDHTLFDTKTFSEETKKFFLKHKVSEEEYLTVAKIQRDRRNNCVDFFELIEDFARLGYNIPKEEINNFVSQEMVQYLKGPVHKTLRDFKDKGFHLILLSKGVTIHQLLKIHGSKLETYFGDKIYISQDEKDQVINKIPTIGVVYFINDHADEIEAIMRIRPDIKFIYVRGPKTHHDRFLNHMHIKTIGDVSELAKILK